MNQKPQVGAAIIITKDDKVLLMKRKGPQGTGTWSTPADIRILERRLKDAQHVRQKRKSGWMSLTFDFERLQMMYLRMKENITLLSGWRADRVASQRSQRRKKWKRLGGMPGMLCPVPFSYLWKTWSKRIAIHRNEA
jgi:hypothetical protein